MQKKIEMIGNDVDSLKKDGGDSKLTPLSQSANPSASKANLNNEKLNELKEEILDQLTTFKDSIKADLKKQIDELEEKITHSN